MEEVEGQEPGAIAYPITGMPANDLICGRWSIVVMAPEPDIQYVSNLGGLAPPCPTLNAVACTLLTQHSHLVVTPTTHAA